MSQVKNMNFIIFFIIKLVKSCKNKIKKKNDSSLQIYIVRLKSSFKKLKFYSFKTITSIFGGGSLRT